MNNESIRIKLEEEMNNCAANMDYKISIKEDVFVIASRWQIEKIKKETALDLILYLENGGVLPDNIVNFNSLKKNINPIIKEKIVDELIVCDFSELLGKTLFNIEIKGDDEILFTTMDGNLYKLFHWQNCCGSVEIEDICGDLNDLIGAPLLVAEEVSIDEKEELPFIAQTSQSDISGTWTFYKLDTIKGGVTIRWYGSSNGYYSEKVDFVKVVFYSEEISFVKIKVEN